MALARAVAVRPRVLLLDEPLTALYAKLKETLRDELAQLLRQLGITALHVTHDQQEAMAMPLYLMPGNHDDREQLRRSFPAHAYLGTSGHVQVSVSVGDFQLVALDSVEHGQSGGRLFQERLDWLEAWPVIPRWSASSADTCTAPSTHALATRWFPPLPALRIRCVWTCTGTRHRPGSWSPPAFIFTPGPEWAGLSRTRRPAAGSMGRTRFMMVAP